MTAAKELTVTERAKKALALAQTEEQLQELARKSEDLTEINSTADYELVKRSALVLRDARVDLQKIGKAARDDANAFSKAIIAEEAHLVGIISPEENRLKAIRKAADDKEAEKLAEARRLEEARVADINRRIGEINKLAETLVTTTAEELEKRLEAAKDVSATVDYFAEFTEQAAEARYEAIDILEKALAARRDFEAQKAEQDRIAAEQAERQAELDRQAEEQREREAAAQAEHDRKAAELAEQERLTQEKRNHEEQARKDAAAEEARKAQEERDRKLAEERAEAERIRKEKEQLEAEARAREEAEQKAAEEQAERERLEAARPDLVRLIIFAEYLADLEGPEVEDPDCKRILETAIDSITDAGNKLYIAVKEKMEAGNVGSQEG